LRKIPARIILQSQEGKKGNRRNNKNISREEKDHEEGKRDQENVEGLG